MKKVRVIVYLALLSNFVMGQCAISSNLVSNGDFELGNSGFSSEYANSPGNLWSESTFDLISNPSMSHSNFSNCGDASSGSGVMMVVNGSQSAGTNIWCQNVDVETGTDYTFSAEITSVHPSSAAILQFSINGANLGTPFIAPNAPCKWNQFCETWNSGVNTSADICIVNQNTAASGNDFAIDNIQMGKVLGALPVTLSSFSVVNDNADVKLNWVSYVEDNHDRYEIERSTDLETWRYLGETNGKLGIEDSASYEFYDYMPHEGLSYYRLKMISKIGEVEYSDVRAIEHVYFSADIVQTFPNPASETMNVSINGDVSRMTVINQMGETVFERVEPGVSEIIPVSGLASGTYYLNFKDNQGKVYNKLFIKN